ncbi:hypothetical protein CYLTODRAFT_261947 [Cylindrobasidium torrendii FP15055 ss-10]|uniref:Uncharacterized protein n=1 Tax=Cylindrobasidium torrendii FP15055 ss-10 TaxID=1314674 RepID=A0A0D7BD29_9AGAR|nr:hypothetical protein CYLTODRAFT_261947 [Cylindrobasidium torrendii FP15055 ss-10]
MVPIGPFDLRSERVPARTQSLSQVTLERNNSSGALSSKRQSMPVNTPPASTANFVNQGSGSDGGSPVAARQKFEATPEEPNEDGEAEAGSKSEKRKSRGMMNKDFKFPTPASSPVQTRTPGRQDSEDLQKVAQNSKAEIEVTEDAPPPRAVTPSNIEVPPPPPVEKERSNSGGTLEDADDEVGDTVEVDLS